MTCINDLEHLEVFQESNMKPSTTLLTFLAIFIDVGSLGVEGGLQAVVGPVNGAHREVSAVCVLRATCGPHRAASPLL